MRKVNIAVKIGKITLPNPVITASGTFDVEKYCDLIDINKLGAVITKTITLNKRLGNSPPRIVETPSGIINSIGLQNEGIDDFIKNKLPELKKYKTNIMVSIGGETQDEYIKLAKILNNADGISAIEINISCPNIRKERKLFAQDKKEIYKIVNKIRKATDLTLITKLSPNVTDITEVAKAAEDAGSDAISLVNTFFAMAIGIDTRKPKLGNITGGLSGPAIKPIALYLVYQVAKSVKIPVIGIGGIAIWEDAVEFLIAGARAVQVGTANFILPDTTIKIIEGIKEYLRKKKIYDITKLTGTLDVFLP